MTVLRRRHFFNDIPADCAALIAHALGDTDA